MPLFNGSSKAVIAKNIGTLMHEVGKSKHVKTAKQAIAIAYAKAGKGYSKEAIQYAKNKRR